MAELVKCAIKSRLALQFDARPLETISFDLANGDPVAERQDDFVTCNVKHIVTSSTQTAVIAKTKPKQHQISRPGQKISRASRVFTPILATGPMSRFQFSFGAERMPLRIATTTNGPQQNEAKIAQVFN